MEDLESELARFEARIIEAEISVKSLAKALSALKKAAQTGTIAELEKLLPRIAPRAEEAARMAAGTATEWKFSARAYLENGFLAELKAAARTAGLDLVDRDGRLSVFPTLLKIEPKDLSIRIGRRTERCLRPRTLAQLLLALQNKPQRFREQSFLDSLYRAYRHACGAEWEGKARGPLQPLKQLHELLTLLPHSDYSIQEFGRDLLLLDRKPDLRTRGGARLLFEGSAVSKERVSRINVYDEHGMEHVYIGVRFVREE